MFDLEMSLIIFISSPLTLSIPPPPLYLASFDTVYSQKKQHLYSLVGLFNILFLCTFLFLCLTTSKTSIKCNSLEQIADGLDSAGCARSRTQKKRGTKLSDATRVILLVAMVTHHSDTVKDEWDT